MKQTRKDEKDPLAGGTAICIQDIDAPKAAVWNQILDLESYPKKVSKVVKSSNYHVSKKGHGGHSIKTRMVLGVLPGYSVCVQCDLLLQPNDEDTMCYQKVLAGDKALWLVERFFGESIRASFFHYT